MTELRHIEVAMNATLATDFVVVQTELLLSFSKAAFDRATAECDSEQPTQRDALARDGIAFARYTVGQEVFHFVRQHVASHN